MIDWMRCSREEARQIAAIAQRAIRLAAKHGVRYEFMEADSVMGGLGMPSQPAAGTMED